jgi:hypothetical protein
VAAIFWATSPDKATFGGLISRHEDTGDRSDQLPAFNLWEVKVMDIIWWLAAILDKTIIIIGLL